MSLGALRLEIDYFANIIIKEIHRSVPGSQAPPQSSETKGRHAPLQSNERPDVVFQRAPRRQTSPIRNPAKRKEDAPLQPNGMPGAVFKRALRRQTSPIRSPAE